MRRATREANARHVSLEGQQKTGHHEVIANIASAEKVVAYVNVIITHLIPLFTGSLSLS